MVERINRFDIKAHRKATFRIVIVLAVILIIRGGYKLINDFRELKKTYQVNTTYVKKYKGLLENYNKVLPNEKLYQDMQVVNNALIGSNNTLTYDVEKYNSDLLRGNSYIDFKEDSEGNILYNSESYGVSLLFPHSWKNRVMVQEIAPNNDKLGTTTILIIDKDAWLQGTNGEIFILYIFNSKDNWNNSEDGISGMHKLNPQGGKFMDYKQDSAIASGLDEALKKNYLDMVSNAESIVKRIKILN